MAVIDSHPHPRVLFVGWEAEDPVLKEMVGLVPTSQTWNGEQSSVRWEDWDAVVSCGSFKYGWGSKPVAVLALGVATLPSMRTKTGSDTVYCGDRHQVSPEFEINDDLQDELGRLVRDDLGPWLRAQSSRPLMTRKTSYGTGLLASEPNEGELHTWFVRDPDGTMIAGAYLCSSGGQVWSVPFVPSRPSRWLGAALRLWHESFPEAFPDRDPWHERAQWMSRDELSALARIEEAEAELEQLVTARRLKIEALRDDLRVAQHAADEGIRRLVASQGDDELTEAVAEALESLGFAVDRRDEVISKGQARQEDLRITPPGGRTGIAEVKGYSSGAKQRDLMKITKYAAIFEREAHQPPERQWYVCNQFLAMDPDLRPGILAGADDDVTEFAADGGAVIDTRELFKLLRYVEDGLMSAEDARAALWNSPPRFMAPPRMPAPGPEPEPEPERQLEPHD